MGQPASSEVETLAAFEQRFSRRGLLVRYARGRVAHFLNRQVMTVSGAAVLLFVNGPLSALAAVFFALLGEALDCLYLRGVERRLRDGRPLRHIYAMSTATAAIQASTISVCVGLCWFGPNSAVSSLFPVAFLAGAAINGGLILPYHRAAAMARLCVYGGMLIVMFGSGWLRDHRFDTLAVMDICGALIMTYLVYMFLHFVVGGFRQNASSTMELIAKGRELARQEKETRQLSLVARNANDSVVLSGADGRITWVNNAFTAITGFSAKEALGQRPGDLLNGPDTDPEMVRRIARAVKLGVPFRGEIQNVTRDGGDIWIETNLVPVLDEAGDVEMTVAIERDVTAARRHAEEMAKARRAAEDGARAKAEFLATMSHEIRTPMNGVIGMADMLHGTDLTEEQRHCVDTIHQSAEALVKIINDILDMSKLDAGKMTLSLGPFDLRACLNQVVALLGAEARAKGLSLSLTGLDTLPARVVADEGRLRQVLINLIGNAVKFTDTGAVVLRVHGEPAEAGCRVRVEVQDTGVGIPAHRLDAIFDSFEQADNATTRRFGGTGLGLSISRMLIEAMGGKLKVRSIPGKGSCFSFELVLAPAKDAQAPPLTPPSDTDLTCLEGRRILLAEDNRVNRILIEKYLRDTPVRLSFAHDGHEAVRKTRDQDPHLVFMDMSMPVMNGLEATRLIRDTDGPQPVIVALTANAFDSDREACMAAGMDGFLSKPIRRADLLTCLLRHCRQSPGPPGA